MKKEREKESDLNLRISTLLSLTLSLSQNLQGPMMILVDSTKAQAYIQKFNADTRTVMLLGDDGGEERSDVSSSVSCKHRKGRLSPMAATVRISMSVTRDRKSGIEEEAVMRRIVELSFCYGWLPVDSWGAICATSAKKAIGFAEVIRMIPYSVVQLFMKLTMLLVSRVSAAVNNIH